MPLGPSLYRSAKGKGEPVARKEDERWLSAAVLFPSPLADSILLTHQVELPAVTEQRHNCCMLSPKSERASKFVPIKKHFISCLHSVSLLTL